MTVPSLSTMFFCVQALNCFAMIVKNKQYPNSSRLRVNMGNIYFDKQKYNPAARMYRMALDQIPDTNKDVRKKVGRDTHA